MKSEINKELKEEFNTIENIISLEIDSKFKIENIKTSMNRINSIFPFRENKFSIETTKDLVKQVNSIYREYLKLETESEHLLHGVEVTLSLKELNKKFNEIVKTSTDTKTVEIAKSGKMIADHYLQIVYKQSCGITF